MRRRSLRAILTMVTFTVLWLVASPARAWTGSAPVCDPRGATMFAPPPQIQDAELSIDIPPDCFDTSESPLETRNVVPGRPFSIDITFTQEPVVATGPVVPVCTSGERTVIPIPARVRPRPGVRNELERPPRA